MNRAELDALKERAQNYVEKAEQLPQVQETAEALRARLAELRAPIEELLSRFDGLGEISRRTLATIMPTLSAKLEELRAKIEE